MNVFIIHSAVDKRGQKAKGPTPPSRRNGAFYSHPPKQSHGQAEGCASTLASSLLLLPLLCQSILHLDCSTPRNRRIWPEGATPPTCVQDCAQCASTSRKNHLSRFPRTGKKPGTSGNYLGRLVSAKPSSFALFFSTSAWGLKVVAPFLSQLSGKSTIFSLCRPGHESGQGRHKKVSHSKQTRWSGTAMRQKTRAPCCSPGEAKCTETQGDAHRKTLPISCPTSQKNPRFCQHFPTPSGHKKASLSRQLPGMTGT